MQGIAKKWIFLLLSTVFLFSTLRITDEWAPISIEITYLTLFIVVLSIFIYKDKVLIYNKITFVLMFILLIFGILSSLVNSDVDSLMRVAVFYVLFISMNIFVPSYFKGNTEKIVAISLIITHIPILYIPILTKGINTIPYYGIFTNPNSVAGVAVTVLMVIVAIACNQVEYIYFGHKTSKLLLALNIIVIMSLLMIISYADSRTSFLSALFVIIFGLSLVLVNVVRFKKIGDFIVRSIVIVPISIALFFILNIYFPLIETVEATILTKFKTKSSRVLDGRAEIWEQAFNMSGFFGGGSDVFFGEIGKGSHNTFIEFLGVFGWVPFIMIILFMLISFYYTIKYFMNSSSKYKYLAPIVFIAFTSLSMAEDMNWKASIIALFVLTGFVSNKTKLTVVK